MMDQRMYMTSRSLAFSCAASVLFLAMSIGPARAQDDQRQQAKQHFRAGEQAYNAGQYLVAARSFEASFKLVKAPEIAFSLAQSYRLQYFVDKQPSRLERSIDMYRFYIDNKPKGARRDVAISHLAELEPILLRMKADGRSFTAQAEASTKVVVVSNAKDAKVTFAGETSDTPLILELEPGTYEVEATAEGYFPGKSTFKAIKGEQLPVEVQLRPKPAKLAVRGTSDAEISINNRREAKIPLSDPIEVLAGQYFVSITRRGHHPWAQWVQVSRDQKLDLSAKLRKTTQRKVSYGLFGAAVLGTIGSATMAIFAAKSDSEAAELKNKLAEGGLSLADAYRYSALRDERNHRVNITIGLISMTTLAALAGGYLYYFDNPRVERPPEPQIIPKDDKKKDSDDDDTIREVSVVPTVSPDMAGLSMVGRF